jgi:hypothetical protein
MPPNFALLDVSRPDVARLVAAMAEARDAVSRRSCSSAGAGRRMTGWPMSSATPARASESNVPVVCRSRRALYALAGWHRCATSAEMLRRDRWPPLGRSIINPLGRLGRRRCDCALSRDERHSRRLVRQIERIDRHRGYALPCRHPPNDDERHRRQQARGGSRRGCGDDLSDFAHRN